MGKKTEKQAEQIKTLSSKLEVMSALVSRTALLSRLGQQYDGDRDIYQALGYPLVLKYEDYAARYSRQDIAKAIIDRPVNATWKGGIKLVETDDDEDTQFEKDWDELYERLGLISKFNRLDKLTGLGEWGILLLGFDDVKQSADWNKPVSGTRKLLYVKPVSQGGATISVWDKNTTSERYGLPSSYTITVTNSDESQTTVAVHWTRVIHVVDGALESETEGVPRLKPVYNRLMDLEKIVGGSGEMFWRGARPGYHGKTSEEYTMTPETLADLKDQIDEYEHNLRRILVNEGVDLKALESQVSDPEKHVDVQIQMISAETGIPKRVLTGSERGELSSGQDSDEWNKLNQNRRDTFAEPNIIRPFIERLIMFKVISAPKNYYKVQWSDLFAPSEKDKAEVGRIRAQALKEYTTNLDASITVPEKAFFRFMLGLDEGSIELIEEMRKEAVNDDV